MASTCEIPAWGEGLFQNKNDVDVVNYLNREMGVVELEQRARKVAAEGKKGSNSNDGPDAAEVRYSVYARFCSSEEAIEAVRKHLDAGPLAQMCAKMVARFFNPLKLSDYTCKGHLPVLLGACAMSLGCKLDGIPGYKMYSNTYREFLSGIYEPAPFMDKAMEQMYSALHGPVAYVDGTPYDFGSLTCAEVVAARAAKGITTPLTREKSSGEAYMGGLPVGYKTSRGLGKAPLGGMAFRIIGPSSSKVDMGYHDSDKGRCARKGCGRKQPRDGGAEKLLQCGKCKDVEYCGKACQKEDWKRHKGCCRTPEDARSMREEGEKWENLFYYHPASLRGEGGAGGGMGGLAAMLSGASPLSMLVRHIAPGQGS
ncbi:hypothetical protein LTR85_008737 [Meristemomyces frigidus]|nr:hypothetical protein LTR85_008737 [Meristemomyces frigidus]